MSMVLAVVPSQDYDECYFMILAPKEEQPAFEFLTKHFSCRYEQGINGSLRDFLTDVLFMLLDVSENIFISKKTARRWV